MKPAYTLTYRTVNAFKMRYGDMGTEMVLEHHISGHLTRLMTIKNINNLNVIPQMTPCFDRWS